MSSEHVSYVCILNASCCGLPLVNFTNIIQGYLTGSRKIVYLIQCQRCNPNCNQVRANIMTATKQRHAKTIWILYWMYYTTLTVTCDLILLTSNVPWYIMFNTMWPSDAIWWHRSVSIVVQLMACCLMPPSHYLNQCWLTVNKVMWHLSESNFIRDTSAFSHWNKLENSISNILFRSTRAGANELTVSLDSQ